MGSAIRHYSTAHMSTDEIMRHGVNYVSSEIYRLENLRWIDTETGKRLDTLSQWLRAFEDKHMRTRIIDREKAESLFGTLFTRADTDAMTPDELAALTPKVRVSSGFFCETDRDPKERYAKELSNYNKQLQGLRKAVNSMYGANTVEANREFKRLKAETVLDEPPVFPLAELEPEEQREYIEQFAAMLRAGGL